MNTYSNNSFEQIARYKQFEKIISNKFGIVQKVYSDPCKDNISKNTIIRSISTSEIMGNAIKRNFMSSITASICEYIERYCAIHKKLEIIFHNKSYDELANHIDCMVGTMEKLNVYDENSYALKKFPYKRYTHDCKVDYCRAIHLNTNMETVMPLPFIGLNNNRKNQSFIEKTSSGIACGDTPEQAILNALYEIIERDAIMYMWWNKASFPMQYNWRSLIDTTISSTFLEDVRIVNITTDINIPVMLAIKVLEGNKIPKVSLGAAANIDSKKAIISAIYELLYTYTGCSRSVKKTNEYFSMSLDQFKFKKNSLTDSVHFYSNPKNEYLYDFIYKNRNTVDTISSHNLNHMNELDFVKSMLKDFDIIVVDLTTKDVKMLNMYVYQVFVLGLIPFNIKFECRPWGVKRLYNQIMTDRILYNIERNLYCCPHPFP